MTGSFNFRGEPLFYNASPYNSSRLNERSVEVPIAQSFLASRLVTAGLEVGNVLSHYLPNVASAPWRVVDKYEGPDRIDVMDIAGSYPWIVSISTLEHVRWDECPVGIRHPDGSAAALDHLLSLLAPGGSLLVTVPFGWQPFFDTQILSGRWVPSFACSMVRAPHSNLAWIQSAVQHRRYAATTPWAESVWVAIFDR